MIVHSLYGILAGETEEGQKSMAVAQQLTNEIDLKYERK